MQEEYKVYEELWRLADNECSPAERRELLAQIEADTEWQQAWKEIQLLDKTLAAVTAVTPHPDFAKHVIAQIKVPLGTTIASASLLSDRTKWSLIGGFVLFNILVAIMSANAEAAKVPDWSLLAWWSKINVWSSLTAYLPATSTVIILLALVSVFSFDQVIGWYRGKMQMR